MSRVLKLLTLINAQNSLRKSLKKQKGSMHVSFSLSVIGSGSMSRSMRTVESLDKGDFAISRSKSSTATRTTQPTSVMPISVTSHETTETITTYVNGRPVHRDEVTKIYVIEPVEDWRRAQSKERADEEIRERRWLADLWLGVWAAWGLYLAWEWMR